MFVMFVYSFFQLYYLIFDLSGPFQQILGWDILYMATVDIGMQTDAEKEVQCIFRR